MIAVGITGPDGFVARHLAAALIGAGHPVVRLERPVLENSALLETRLAGCDRVVHLAGLSRHPAPETLYRVNMDLNARLDDALQKVPRPLYFASTTHWRKNLAYHRSKRDGRKLLEHSGIYPVITLRIANLFGSGSRPFYNSAVSTFCRLAAGGKTPERVDDVLLELLHIDEFISGFLPVLLEDSPSTQVREFPAKHVIPLPELWRTLVRWRETPPVRPQGFEKLLWETFTSYF